jgi:hypothetical protein
LAPFLKMSEVLGRKNMTNFYKFKLGQLGKVGMGIMVTTATIATLTACGKETPPTVASPTISPTPIASASPSPTPSVAAVPPVATPVTVAIESTKTNAPAPSPVASAAPPATTNTAPNRAAGICKANEGAIISVETKNYRVAICGKGEPEFYVGVEKDDPTKSIRLPLTTFSPGFYEAANGNTTYILAKTPKGHFLTVTQGDKELLREVISGWGN